MKSFSEVTAPKESTEAGRVWMQKNLFVAAMDDEFRKKLFVALLLFAFCWPSFFASAATCISGGGGGGVIDRVLTLKVSCNDSCVDPNGLLQFSTHECCGTSIGEVVWTVTGSGANQSDLLGLKFTPGSPGSAVNTLRYEPASDIPGTVRPGTLSVTAHNQVAMCGASITIVIEVENCCETESCSQPPPPVIPPNLNQPDGYWGSVHYQGSREPTPLSPTKPLLLRKKSSLAGAVDAVGSPNAAKAAIALGAGDFGDVAGALYIFEEVPTTGLSTPSCLHYAYSNSYNEVIMVAGKIKQVRAPSAFLDVTTVSAYKYTVDYYKTNVITGKSGDTYTFSGAPLGTITIENTNTTGSASNTFRITDKDGFVQDYVFSTNGVTNIWEKTTGGGLRKDINASSWSGSNKTVRAETWNAAGVLEAIRIDTYTNAPFGVRRLQSIEGSGAAVRTNTYEYWSNGPIRLVTSSGGRWTYTEYDTNSRPTNVFSAYGAQAPTNNPALCRQIEYSYDPGMVSGSGDTNSLAFMRPRRTIERLFNNEVSRTYFVALEFEQREIVCVNPGAAWNDSSNLVTITKLVSDTNLFYRQPKSIFRPDGALTLFEYSTNSSSQTVTTYIGQPGDTNNTNVIAGTKSISVTGNLGQPVSETVIDIASGIILSSMTYTNYDDANRPKKLTLLDGTSIGTDYGCCGALYTTNQDGSILKHSQDALGRYTSTTYSSVTASNIFDAAGRLLARLKIGTNGSVITEVTNTYDTAGRLLTSKDALGNTATYSESADGLCRTNTAPDGSTRMELYLPDGSLWKYLGTAVHPVRYTNGVESLDGQYRLYDQEIKLDGNGSDTSEWTKTYRDFAGRHYKTVYADGAYSQSFYNLKGQLIKQTDPDGVTILHAYDSLGDQVVTALDMDRDGVIDTNGTDRITMRVSTVANVNSRDSQISRSYIWATNNSSVSNLVSETITTVAGDITWQVSYNGATGITNRADRVVGANGNNYTTNTAPDGSYTVSHTLHGLLQSVTRNDSGGNQLAARTYTYDAYGRQNTETDARNGTTTNTFDKVDRVIVTSTPTPASGHASQQTGYCFDALGRITAITNADGAVLFNEYFASGELKKTYGARTYPVEYTYDYAGRMKTMKTWQDYAGGLGTSATTTWNYDGYRGFMTNKVYADGNGPKYKYTPAGRLYQRTWARGVTTTYTTNAAGDVASIDYSDSTTDVTYTYDRLGRQTTIVDGAGTHLRAYELDGRLFYEYNSAGILTGRAVTNRYDSLKRRTALGVFPYADAVVQYGYDTASRLIGVTNGVNTATYSYIANSPLVSQIEFKNSGTTRMTTAKSYDYLNRLTLITNNVGGAGFDCPSFSYANNNANQRTAITNADGSRWIYSYDALGQVTSGRKYWNDGTPVAGQQFDYTFDDIGNRKTAAGGGDENGLRQRRQSYTANNLNQYTQRTVPGYLDIVGTATNTAIVTVNHSATVRKNDYYRAEVPVANGSSAIWQAITNVAVLASGTNDHVTNWIGNVFTPNTPEAFGYDADGNQTSDGRWTNTWDAENQLITMTSHASSPSGSRFSLKFGYDAQHRRISKVVSNWTGSAWAKQSENRFIYDGWNLLAMLSESNTLQLSFCWGTDLSGSMRGAGGVGGLISLTVHTGAVAGVYFPAYDGNGNVAGLISASDGTIAGIYEYDPFHRLLRATGPLALVNPFLASTKFQDWETGLYYYGYRFYDAVVGRWLGRDPIGEKGGRHLYQFCNNNAKTYFDMLGTEIIPIMPPGSRSWEIENFRFGLKWQYSHGGLHLRTEGDGGFWDILNSGPNFVMEGDSVGWDVSGWATYEGDISAQLLLGGNLTLNSDYTGSASLSARWQFSGVPLPLSKRLLTNADAAGAIAITQSHGYCAVGVYLKIKTHTKFRFIIPRISGSGSASRPGCCKDVIRNGGMFGISTGALWEALGKVKFKAYVFGFIPIPL